MGVSRRSRAALSLGSSVALVGSAWVTGALVHAVPAAQGEIIGVQFYSTNTAGTGTTAASIALNTNQTAGVPSDPNVGSVLQANWNAQGVTAPGTVATGSITSPALVDYTGASNALGASFAYQSGDMGGSHKGGVYNTEMNSGATGANPNGAGYYQTSLLDGALTVNSNSASSVAQFQNVPLTGYNYAVVVYTAMYGTTVERLQIGGTAELGANASGTYSEGTPTLTSGVAGPGGYGTNPTTGTDQVYVTQQAGPSSGSADTTSDANYDFDGTDFYTNPIAFPGNSTTVTASTSASNYVIWTNVIPDSSGDILISWNKYGGLTTNPPTTVEGINAIQLIATPITAMPEPASLGLLALGGTMLLNRRRDKSRADKK